MILDVKFRCWYRVGTDWAGGVYIVTMDFPEEYPSKVIFHRSIHVIVSFSTNFAYALTSRQNASLSRLSSIRMFTPLVPSACHYWTKTKVGVPLLR